MRKDLLSATGKVVVKDRKQDLNAFLRCIYIAVNLRFHAVERLVPDYQVRDSPITFNTCYEIQKLFVAVIFSSSVCLSVIVWNADTLRRKMEPCTLHSAIPPVHPPSTTHTLNHIVMMVLIKLQVDHTSMQLTKSIHHPFFLWKVYNREQLSKTRIGNFLFLTCNGHNIWVRQQVLE